VPVSAASPTPTPAPEGDPPPPRSVETAHAPQPDVQANAQATAMTSNRSIVSAALVLSVPKDGIAQQLRSSPGIRIHGRRQLRDRIGLAASIDYVRGMNQTEITATRSVDTYSLSGGLSLVISESATHSLVAEGMLSVVHLSIEDSGVGVSGTGVGFLFALGLDVPVGPRWHATAMLGYSSAGVGLAMSGGEATVGVDFLQLGMGAGAWF